MLEVRLPYYPKRIATLSESPFGVPELDCPKIYDNPLSNKFILRVDVLNPLVPVLGDDCMFYRNYVYNIVAGNVPDFNKALQNLYNKFPCFRNYVNEEFYFGDTTRPLSERILEYFQSLILGFETSVRSNCEMVGGKYLTYTHYYLYYSYTLESMIPHIDGGTVIC